jgi:cell wall-associated NlpC family hydrolase
VRLFGPRCAGTTLPASISTVLAAFAVLAAPLAQADTGGAGAMYFPLPPGGMSPPALGPAPGKTITATVGQDGRTAVAPAGAPVAVGRTIRAANRIAGKPYRWGGGHRRFVDSAYDCSGAVSFALHGAGLVPSPLDSTAFMHWGDAGAGSWITVYASRRHAFVVIAGLRFDTSGPGAKGPRWRPSPRPAAGFTVRHFPGL